MTQLATIAWDEKKGSQETSAWDDIPEHLIVQRPATDTGSHPALTRVSRISRKPSVMGGAYVIGGTRLPVFWLYDMLLELGSVEAVHAQYPHLEIDDVFAAISFALSNTELVNADREAYRLASDPASGL